MNGRLLQRINEKRNSSLYFPETVSIAAKFCCLLSICSSVLTKVEILFSQAQNPNEPNFKIPSL